MERHPTPRDRGGNAVGIALVLAALAVFGLTAWFALRALDPSDVTTAGTVVAPLATSSAY